MGVLGLGPFLQKKCPEAFKKLPDRMKGLDGKTIVMDGTLITQRLHFAPMPHAHRHVLGWYRLMKEIQDCGVRVICVFDGKERSTAKSREIERRRQVYRLDVARGSIEADRLRRLRRLVGLLESYRSLKDSEQEHATLNLRKLAVGAKRTPDISASSGALEFLDRDQTSWIASSEADFTESEIEDILSDPFEPTGCSSKTVDLGSPDLPLNLGHRRLPYNSYADTFPRDYDYGANYLLDSEHFSLSQLNPDRDAIQARGLSNEYSLVDDLFKTQASPWRKDHDAEVRVPSTENGRDPTPVASSVAPCGAAETRSAGSRSRMTVSPSPPITLENPIVPSLLTDISSALTSLYLEYQRSIPKLTSLSSPTEAQISSTVLPDMMEAGVEYAMSKSQYQLTLEEGKLWDQLAESARDGQIDGTAEATVSSLAEKSDAISQSYERRSNPPSSETYEECKQMLRAMGVPCVESTGPFEAEALAASLVINGYADYVASEDTDVLIYEAPLIRNITNRTGPLIIVSGSEARAVLELDRSSWVDFALLLGTDFSQRIKNVGPHRALKFIRQYGSIERVIESEPQYPPRISIDRYLEQVETARLVFQTLPPVPDSQLLQTKENDDPRILALLERYGLHRAAMYDWEYSTALDGNYFQDDPTAY